MSEEILTKIKSKGYWEIEIKPVSYKNNRLSLNELKLIIEKSQVRKRGWYYPHISHLGDIAGESFNGSNYYQSLIDYNPHIEIFRLYTSGQFIHYLSLWEDWSNNSFFQEKRILEIIMTLYTLTEIFLFASRISDNFENDDINIKLKLNNQYDRSLNFYNKLRFLDYDYRCKIQSPIIIEKKISKTDLDSNNSDIALDVLIHIFNIFNWDSKEIRNILKEDQKKFLSMNY